MGLMAVREGERRNEGVVGGEQLWRTERERKAATGRGDALRLLGCLGLAPRGVCAGVG